MKTIKHISFLFFLFTILNSTAQVQSKYDMAASLYKRLAYSDAIKYLNEFLSKKPNDLDGQIMLADCYRQTNQYTKAEEMYKKVTDNVDLKDNVQKLFYAQILQANGKYPEAAHMYESFLLFYPKDARAANQLNACKNIESYTSYDPLDYLITNLPFNTDGYDFGACVNNNKFYYTSTGSKEQKDVKTDKYLNEPYMNLFEVDVQDSTNSFSEAKPLSTGVNTKFHEGPMCFCPFSDIVYFTRNDYNPDKKGRKFGFGSDKIINLKIYQATVKDSAWIKNVELPFNSKDYSCGHPTVDAKNKVMYFTSDMPGGFGGTDIWKSKFDENTNKWGKPENLGQKVNTEGNEMFPFFHSSRTLFFASDGLAGLGGLDIFAANMSDDDEPTKVMNVGAPLNSSRDDFGLLLSDDKQKGYFSSNRDGGKGEDDIYKLVYNKFELEGLVVNKITQQPMENATVQEFINAVKNQDFTTNKDGKFNDIVRGTQTCKFIASVANFQSDSAQVYIEPLEYSKKYFVKMELIPIVGEILVIDAITKQPIENAKIDLNSACLNTNPLNLVTANTGKSYFDIKNSCEYNLLANAKGYLPNTSKIVAMNIRDTLHAVIELKPINSDIVTLNNIYYDFDKWYIRPDALPDLNMLLSFMNNNPDAVVELGSHTDARGDDAYNLRLSQYRAQSVVEWLISKGIKKDKIVPVGYGETKPLNNCTNGVTCSEEDHQINRRTEFKVLNAGQVTVSQNKTNVNVDRCKKCPF